MLMQVQTLTFEQLIIAAAVILVLIGVYNTIMTAIKNYREEKRRQSAPVTTMEQRVEDHEVKLKRDHERLNDLEESNRIIMRALMAMLSHEINGNSDDKLKTSFEEIQKFLIER